jgi:hypothetical protein
MDVLKSILGHLKTEPIEIPEYKDLPHKFTIRTLSGADRSRIVAAYEKDRAGQEGNAVALMVALSLGDEKGERIFEDSNIHKANDLPARVLDQVSLASQKFNYLGSEALDEAKKA